jgi:FkbM family methyltransferase
MLIRTPLGPFEVYPTGTITRALQDGQWWDDHLKPILDEAARGMAIDIGAHFGWFTLYLAQRHEVIAVEPWPATFALLTQNVQRRPGLQHRIQCWPLAAYDRTTALEFARTNDRTDAGAFGFTRPSFIPEQDSYGMVAAVALDTYLPPDAPVTVIKCDAQGADLRALRGLQQTIVRCRPLIVFEWEEGMAAWQGDSWQDYLDFFGWLNYSVVRISMDYYDYVARPR